MKITRPVTLAMVGTILISAHARSQSPAPTDTPCAVTRNDQQTACLEAVKSCHATCGPFADGKVHYWCVGEFDTLATAAFCAADPAAASMMDECWTTMSAEGQMLGAMTCDPL